MLTNEPSVDNDGQNESNRYLCLTIETKYSREMYIRR
jgi:hypothetical protein